MKLVSLVLCVWYIIDLSSATESSVYIRDRATRVDRLPKTILTAWGELAKTREWKVRESESKSRGLSAQVEVFHFSIFPPFLPFRLHNRTHTSVVHNYLPRNRNQIEENLLGKLGQKIRVTANERRFPIPIPDPPYRAPSARTNRTC